MTDFVQRVMRPEHPDFIIRSLLDNDFYKFTMALYIFGFHRGLRVKFRSINRHKFIPVAHIVDEAELRKQLDHVRTLRFSRTDIYYLRGLNVYQENMFSEEYLHFLSTLQMPEYKLRRVGDQYEFTTEGAWEEVTWWETLYLAILSELFYKKLMETMTPTELDILYARAKDKLYRKLLVIRSRPWIRFADFGYRRRHSHLWHKYVLEMAQEVVPEQFTGASSAWMAFNQDLVPIGTNAHELPMVLTAIAPDEEKRLAQYQVLREWQQLFPKGGLRIVLPDTYGSMQFFEGMPKDLAEEVAHNWRGSRLDSGDPIVEGNAYIAWLRSYGVNPWTEDKAVIPSDGLDVGPIIEIDDALQGSIKHPYGWGTTLTNGFEDCHPRGDELAVVNGIQLALTNNQLFRGHSFVCKVESAEGKPAVKLSNNVNKATGPADEIERYLHLFGHKGRGAQEVLV
jgi:nicotinate phosphoribosyltransferase